MVESALQCTIVSDTAASVKIGGHIEVIKNTKSNSIAAPNLRFRNNLAVSVLWIATGSVVGTLLVLEIACLEQQEK